MKFVYSLILFLIPLGQLFAYEIYYDVDKLVSSPCYQEYVNVAQGKLRSFQAGNTNLRDKREYNLYHAALKGEGHFTFKLLYEDLLPSFAGISKPVILDWFRYGFVSGDLCPSITFVNSYYNWKMASKYIKKTILKEIFIPKIK